MKAIPAILLVITSHSMVFAQNKNNLYIDLGVNCPGVSVTYDKKLMRHFDIGAGFSIYDFSDVSYGSLRSACYLDLRPYWLIGRSLLFVPAGVGLAFNGGKEPSDGTMSTLGLYTALGFGYCYQINKRGMGPYLSLGMRGYTENIHYRNPPPAPRKGDYSYLDANLVLSAGFKF